MRNIYRPIKNIFRLIIITLLVLLIPTKSLAIDQSKLFYHKRVISTQQRAMKGSWLKLLEEKLTILQNEILANKDKLAEIGNELKEEIKNELETLKDNIPELPKPPIKPEPPIDPIPPIDPQPPTDPDTGGTTPEIPQPPEDKDAPKILKHEISEDKKTITLIFDEKLNNNITNIKENITIGINNSIIELNKYDKASIEEDKLIIELENGLLATNNSITIKSNIIGDTNDNYITEPIELKDIIGLGKTIVFVKDEAQLQKYINGKNRVDIIKLENDIQLTTSTKADIRLENVTIDGSNGESNYKIEGVSPSITYDLNIYKNNITIKNLDLNNISIKANDKRELKLKNLNMNLNKPNTPSILLDKTTAEGMELTLQNEYTGILLTSSMASVLSSRSNLTIEGTIQNSSGAAITVLNPITNETITNLNTVTKGINIKNLNELFTIETIVDGTNEYNIYTNI